MSAVELHEYLIDLEPLSYAYSDGQECHYDFDIWRLTCCSKSE